jgi:hypothetical protein
LLAARGSLTITTSLAMMAGEAFDAMLNRVGVYAVIIS